MGDPQLKSIIVLSAKSSGSSICQDYLASFSEIRHIRKTRHCQKETLYWVKAASVLDYPQEDILDSEVPIAKEQARKDLLELFDENLGRKDMAIDSEEEIFEGWKALCAEFQPVFLEKSPHHLHQWSALKLICRCMEKKPEIGFCLLGLVRNPMDALYSAYRRWKTPPEKAQYEWLTAYRNLQRLKEIASDNLLIVRYEDIVRDASLFDPVLDFASIDRVRGSSESFHKHSLAKWKSDLSYGFVLAEPVKELARQYGYTDKDLDNQVHFLWPVRKKISRKIYRGETFFKNVIKSSPIGPPLVRLNRKIRGLG